MTTGYIQRWIDFLTDPKTIVSLGAGALALAAWAYSQVQDIKISRVRALAENVSEADSLRLKQILDSIDVSKGEIWFTNDNGFRFVTKNGVFILQGNDATITVWKGKPENKGLFKFGAMQGSYYTDAEKNGK